MNVGTSSNNEWSRRFADLIVQNNDYSIYGCYQTNIRGTDTERIYGDTNSNDFWQVPLNVGATLSFNYYTSIASHTMAHSSSDDNYTKNAICYVYVVKVMPLSF